MITNIIEILKENQEIIEKCINLDNRKMSEEFKFHDLIKICEKINKKNYEIKNKTNPNTFMIIYNGNPRITLEMLLINLFCKNNLIFIIHDDFLGTNNILISIIEKIIKQSNINCFIKLYNNISLSEIPKTEELADKIIYIGDKFNYQNFKGYTSLPIIYNGYGQVLIYTDDEMNFQKELDETQKYAFENDIAITLYNKDIEGSIENINYDVSNDVSVIFSNDNEKIEKFKNEVHSKKIFVNENPFVNYEFEFNFDINDLI